MGTKASKSNELIFALIGLVVAWMEEKYSNGKDRNVFMEGIFFWIRKGRTFEIRVQFVQ